jgi:hypothetical protein
MADFFTNLLVRSAPVRMALEPRIGWTGAVLQPRLPSLFEPAGDGLATPPAASLAEAPASGAPDTAPVPPPTPDPQSLPAQDLSSERAFMPPEGPRQAASGHSPDPAAAQPLPTLPEPRPAGPGRSVKKRRREIVPVEGAPSEAPPAGRPGRSRPLLSQSAPPGRPDLSMRAPDPLRTVRDERPGARELVPPAASASRASRAEPGEPLRAAPEGSPPVEARPFEDPAALPPSYPGSNAPQPMHRAGQARTVPVPPHRGETTDAPAMLQPLPPRGLAGRGSNPPPAAAASLPRAAEAGETVVQVHIGRIEVRAAAPVPALAPPPARASLAGPKMSLDEYLRQRDQREEQR